jgi:hypothetical protein
MGWEQFNEDLTQNFTDGISQETKCLLLYSCRVHFVEFLCRSFCYGMGHNTEFMFFSVCAVHLAFDMKVIFQMFEETLQRT